MKSIKLIKKLVEQELKEIDGGIMDPNMVPFVPHREPAADTADDPKEVSAVDRLYMIALKAREATEELVVALDEPIYDAAYEAAFKATGALRDALNALEGVGADPAVKDRVVAPPPGEQPGGSMPWSSNTGIQHLPMTYSGDTV